jgi:hypothetical protein
MPITTRNPKAIAAELQSHIERANTYFVPPTALTVIALASEFCASVAERLDAAGMATDPEPADPQQPEA